MLRYFVLLLFLILTIPSVASVVSATPISEAETVANDLNNVEFYYDRANAKLASGDKEGAIEDYSRAIKFDPKNPSLYNNRGLAKYALGNYQGAVEDYSLNIYLLEASLNHSR